MNNQQRPAQPAPSQGRPMGPMGRGGMVLGVQKAHDFNGTVRTLLVYLNAYRVSLIIAVIFAIASTVFTVVGPKIMGLATTKLFEGVVGQITGSGSGIDFGYIGNIVLILAGLYLVASAFSYLQGWIIAGAALIVTYRLPSDTSQ